MMTLIMQVGLMVAKFALEKAADKREAMKIFWDFVEQIKKNHSSDMQKDEERQLEELEKLKGK